MKNQYLGNDLIFIISQPKSGSTLLQRVLSGHPEIQTSAETWLLLHPLYALKKSGIETEYGAEFAAKGVEDFLVNYTTGGEVYDDAIREWARVIYGNAIDKGRKKYFLDKTPRYFFVIPELYRIFPKAKFIFLIRNPLAVLASELSTYVKGDWPILSVFQYDLTLAPHKLLEGISLLGNDAIIIKYETFVADPENSIARLCENLGISFHREMLDYSKTPKPKGIMNDPIGIDRHTKPSTASLNKWKMLGADRQLRHFAISYLEHLGREIVEKMGYSYEELREGMLSNELDSSNSNMIFPWDIAIRPNKTWTLHEWFIAERYFSVRRKGKFKGTLSAIKKGLLRMHRQVKHQLAGHAASGLEGE